MTWRVEPTLIDEYVLAPRDAWRVVNERGEVADDSVSEDKDTASAMADELNREQVVEDARWLADRVYEFELVGPRRRTCLNNLEMEKFLSIRHRLASQ